MECRYICNTEKKLLFLFNLEENNTGFLEYNVSENKTEMFTINSSNILNCTSNEDNLAYIKYQKIDDDTWNYQVIKKSKDSFLEEIVYEGVANSYFTLPVLKSVNDVYYLMINKYDALSLDYEWFLMQINSDNQIELLDQWNGYTSGVLPYNNFIISNNLISYFSILGENDVYKYRLIIYDINKKHKEEITFNLSERIQDDIVIIDKTVYLQYYSNVEKNYCKWGKIENGKLSVFDNNYPCLYRLFNDNRKIIGISPITYDNNTTYQISFNENNISFNPIDYKIGGSTLKYSTQIPIKVYDNIFIVDTPNTIYKK